MFEKPKEDVENVRKIMCELNGNTNKEIEHLKNHFKAEKTVTEMNNYDRDSKADVTNRRISALENKTMKIITLKDQIEK